MWLEVDRICVSLGGNAILRDVSFSVDKGQFATLLGPSGAGKSTALSVISGLLPQDSGTVRLGGQAIDEEPAYRRNIAVVFQDIRLFPNMNVADNVAFPLKMRKVDKAERLRVAHEMLEAVHLPDVGARRPWELSGGQQQRVALARALAAKPRVILLDEPFSGLDEQLRDDMRDLVLSLHDRFAMTALMVTHDADEAITMSDRVIYLEGGSVLQEGQPIDLLEHPATPAVAACFGESSVLEGTVQQQVFRSRKLSLPAPGIPDGRAAFVRVEGSEPFIHPLTR